MLKAFKYRLWPSKSQKQLLEKTFEECRWLYNKTLEARIKVYEKEQKSLSKFAPDLAIKGFKAQRPELDVVFSQVLQDVQARVDKAYKNFFRRVKSGKGEKPGFPRFKGYGRYFSFTYPQFGFKIVDGQLRLSKIGLINVNWHRPIEGKIKTVTVSKTPTGKWFVSFACIVESKRLSVCNKTIGIDMGLETFATLSNGDKIENPRFFRTEEKALAKVQRRLSKAQKGINDRINKRKIVARVHERVKNKRHNFVHQTARELINQFGTIIVENLNIAGMLKNHCLAKSITDASWNQFFVVLSSKAEEAGRQVIKIDPRNTSKKCSRCGILVDKKLSCRVHQCPSCGLSLGRDLNAAINIKAVGMHGLGLSYAPRSPAL